MTAYPPAAPTAPAIPARATAGWLAFSAAMTAQVPPIAGRADLTVTAAPGAGHGHAACFTPATATIEIDGRHLPVDPATADPARPSDRERYPALWGATVHECAHAAHTRWHPPKGANPAWADAATQLEESRIEHHQVIRRPGDRRWLRACTRDLVVGDFTAAAAPPASPAEAGSAAALILARGDAGILEPAECDPVEQAVTSVIGPAKMRQLRQVWRAAHAAGDTDARTMIKLGRRWCRILGIAPDQPAPADPAGGTASTSPVGKAVSKATAAITAAVTAEFAPPPPAFPPGKDAQRAAENTARENASRAARQVFQPGPGGSAPASGSREPTDAEQAAARRLARALRAASAGERAATTITSATPPGRLKMRQVLAADAQRAAGALPTAHPFTRTQRRRVPAPPLKVGIMCDVSGSMLAYTAPVASAGWILARAAATIPAAQTATVTYGEQVTPVTHPGHAPAKVTEFNALDCYEEFTTAVDALDGALSLSRPGAARLLVIISDGHYKDTQYPNGQKQINRLTASGCGVLWIAPDTPSDPAKPMKGTQVITLNDPAATADAIAKAATRALTA
jgi:hypothetical protein